VVLDISSAFKGIDGILGMDFFIGQTVYFHFPTRTVWIGKAEKISPPSIYTARDSRIEF
jgi:hypothetical protein